MIHLAVDFTTGKAVYEGLDLHVKTGQMTPCRHSYQ